MINNEDLRKMETKSTLYLKSRKIHFDISRPHDEERDLENVTLAGRQKSQRKAVNKLPNALS